MDVDAKQYQDATEIVDVTVDVIPVPFLAVTDVAATIAVYGLFFSSFSVEDAVVILLAVTVAVAMTAVSGLSFFLSSVEDAVTIHVVITVVAIMVAVATIAANKRNF